MLTGTPLALIPLGPLVSALGSRNWVPALDASWLALWWPRSRCLRTPLSVARLAAFMCQVATHAKPNCQQHDAIKAEIGSATALLLERYKTVGERIAQMVESFDRVVWMPWRETQIRSEFRAYGANDEMLSEVQ
jgi:hypothetical protein